MKLDILGYIAMVTAALMICLMFSAMASQGQQIPLESHLDGQDEASANNVIHVESAKASITGATIADATITTSLKLNEWHLDLDGEPANEVLATTTILSVSKIIPVSIYDLIRFPDFPYIYSSIASGGTKADATDTASQIQFVAGTGIELGISDNALSVTNTVTDTVGNAYTSLGIEGSVYDATDSASQFRFAAGSNIDIERTDNELTISASFTGGSDRGNPVFVIGAADSVNGASADYQCDYVSDEIEIQEAINRLGPAGGDIYLLAGTYYIGGIINIATNNVRLRGAGIDSTILLRRFGGTQLADGGLIIVAADYIELSQFAIDGELGTYTDATYNTGIKFEGDHGLIRNLLIYDCKTYALFINNSANVGISNCVFKDCTGANVYVSANSIVNFNGCYSSGSDSYGYTVYGSGNTAMFTNCYSTLNSDYGFSSGAYGGVTFLNCMSLDDQDGFSIAPNTHVIGCEANSPTGDGIVFIGGTSNCGAIGNRIISAGDDGIYLLQSTSNVDISDNYIYQAVDDGIYAYTTTGGINIRNNSIIDCGGTGISFSGGGSSAAYNLITGNKVYQCDEYAINVAHCSIIQDNVFSDNGANGSNACIYINAQKWIYLINNILYDSQGTSKAIFIDDVSTDSIVTVSGNQMLGVFAEGVDSSSNLPTAHESFMQPIYSSTIGGVSSQYVLGGSSAVQMALGYEGAGLGNILSVTSTAPTNPIATSWDQWSDPEKKEKVRFIEKTEKNKFADDFSKLSETEILFDWKSDAQRPDVTNYIEDTTGKEQYERDLDHYNKRKAEWESNKNRINQRGFDISHADFPDRLKSYDSNGKAVGISSSQMMFEMYNALQVQRDEITALKKEVEELKAR